MNKHWLTVVTASCIGFWLFLSFFRLVYNYYKYFKSELYLYTKNDNEKRKLYFGDLHDFSQLVISRTNQRSIIMFYKPEPRSHFLASYYVYPRLIFVVRSIHEAKSLLKKQKIDYILYYGADKKIIELFSDYKIFARFSGIEDMKEGLLLHKND